MTYCSKGLAPKIIAVAQNWRREIARVLSAGGLSDATALPLVHLLRYGDGIRQNCLAERVGVDSTALVRVLDGLERNQLVRRVPDERDRRAKLVYLTDEGRAMATHVEEMLSGIRDRLLIHAAPADLETMDRVLDLILQAFNGSATSPQTPSDS